MHLKLFSLLLTTTLCLTSCEISVNRTSTQGGYTFDKVGEKRSRSESGALEGEVYSVAIDQMFGQVTVQATDGAPEFSWDLSCWGTTAEDAERHLNEIRLEHTASDGSHQFSLILPENKAPSLRGLESNLIVKIPADANVKVENRFGDSQVRGIRGSVTGSCQHCSVNLEDLEGIVDWETSFDDLNASRISGGVLRNSHGALHIDQVSGNLEVETSFDTANITGVGGKLNATNKHAKLVITDITGPLDAQTSFALMSLTNIKGTATLKNSHGEIEGRELEGEIDAKTSFAKIDLESTCDRIKVENSHGSIDLKLMGSSVGFVELETSFGDISLEVSEELNPQIHVEESHGNVETNGIPVLLSEPASKEPKQNRIDLKVRHGDIKLSRHAASPNSEIVPSSAKVKD